MERLGVGILYNPALSPLFEAEPDSVDFVSVIPDMFWRDHGVGSSARFEEMPSWLDTMDDLAANYPVIAHNIGLSLGSAHRWDTQYLDQLARWQERYRFRWHSDHLSFVQIDAPSGGAHNAGMALPIPFDHDVLDMVARRCQQVGSTLGVPFLVENGVAYAEVPECELSEPDFLRTLCERAGCGLVLDLHNLYVDARNRGQDPHQVLATMDLSGVTEVHMAGGTELAGMYTDSHSGASPEVVFELLARVVARAPSLAAVTFEFHDSYYPRLKLPGILTQLEKMRSLWESRPDASSRVEHVRETGQPFSASSTTAPKLRSLGEFQRALCDLIASPSACVAVAEKPIRALSSYDLSQRDRRRVAAMVSSPGMRVNCTLYRMNRVTPIYSLLPRTCTALGDRLSGILDAFWAESPDTDLQFAAESERFGAWLEHKAVTDLDDRFVADVLLYERTLNRFKYDPAPTLAPTVLEFQHEPRHVTARPEDAQQQRPPPRVSPAYVMLRREGDEVVTTEVPGPHPPPPGTAPGGPTSPRTSVP